MLAKRSEKCHAGSLNRARLNEAPSCQNNLDGQARGNRDFPCQIFPLMAIRKSLAHLTRLERASALACCGYSIELGIVKYDSRTQEPSCGKRRLRNARTQYLGPP